MPIQQSLWRLTSSAQKLQPARLTSEKQLEDFIVENPEMLDPNWMLIGRQVQTDFKGVIDLLALQPDGTPVVIELKRDKTSREVLAGCGSTTRISRAPDALGRPLPYASKLSAAWPEEKVESSRNR